MIWSISSGPRVRWFVLCVCGGLVGLIARNLPSDEGEILRRIKELRGRVIIDESSSSQGNVEVDLSGCPVQDDDLRLIGQLTHLRELDVSYSYVTGAGLRWLTANATLEALWAKSLDLRDVDVPTLAAIRSLKRLGLAENTGLTGCGFRDCVFPCLEQLDLSGCTIGERSLQCLYLTCPRLKSLYIQTELPIQACYDIARINTLEELIFSGWLSSDDQVAALAGLTHLTTLDISDSPISDAGLGKLHGCTELRTLNIWGTRITGEALPGFLRLEDVTVGGPQITDDSMRYIAQIRNLRALWLSDVAVTTKGLQHLQRCSKLAELDLWRFKLAPQALSGLSSLSTLSLQNCDLSEGALGELPYMKALKEVRLEACQVSDEHLRTLVRVPHLQSLQIHQCEGLTDASTPAILLLKGIPSLDFDFFQLSPETQQVLREELKNLKTD